MYREYKEFLSNRQENHLYRKIPRYKNNEVVNFSSNDYLGLSNNQAILEAAKIAGEQFGCGSTGSRLLSGNYSIIEDLEKRIARDKYCEDALIFTSGFLANYSVISALLDIRILKNQAFVFMDKLCHSSIYEGVSAASNSIFRFRHNDLSHLKDLLEKYKNDVGSKFIFVESLYGMDGDFCDMEKIQNLAQKYDAFLYVDEAHSTGIYEYQKFYKKMIRMGTFSKAIGCSGGYIACDSIIKDYIVNHAKAFIYSTSPSPLAIGAALEAWKLLPLIDEKKTYIKNLSDYLRHKLDELQISYGNSSSHIFPIFLKNNTDVLHAKNYLAKFGIIVSAIRQPTVPTPRLRIAINANHNKFDIDNLCIHLEKIVRNEKEKNNIIFPSP